MRRIVFDLLRRAPAAALLFVALAMPAAAPAGSCPPACGTPATAGDTPRTADCLFILRACVGSVDCYPECICRLTGGENVRVLDAFVCLRSAVGVTPPPSCDCEATTSTTLPEELGHCGESGADCHSLFDCHDVCYGACQESHDTCYEAAEAGYEDCVANCASNDDVCPRVCLLQAHTTQNWCDDVYDDCAKPCDTELCERLHFGERFEDTGLTIIDHQTQLEWEKKTPQNVEMRYSWAKEVGGTEPDGTVSSRFIDGLNDCRSKNGCFAGHCDWRLPSISVNRKTGEHAELDSIRKVLFCGDRLGCVDPLFGPVSSDYYWSSVHEYGGVWVANFGYAYPLVREWPGYWSLPARAVREYR